MIRLRASRRRLERIFGVRIEAPPRAVVRAPSAFRRYAPTRKMTRGEFRRRDAARRAKMGSR